MNRVCSLIILSFQIVSCLFFAKESIWALAPPDHLDEVRFLALEKRKETAKDQGKKFFSEEEEFFQRDVDREDRSLLGARPNQDSERSVLQRAGHRVSKRFRKGGRLFKEFIVKPMKVVLNISLAVLRGIAFPYLVIYKFRTFDKIKRTVEEISDKHMKWFRQNFIVGTLIAIFLLITFLLSFDSLPRPLAWFLFAVAIVYILAALFTGGVFIARIRYDMVMKGKYGYLAWTKNKGSVYFKLHRFLKDYVFSIILRLLFYPYYLITFYSELSHLSNKNLWFKQALVTAIIGFSFLIIALSACPLGSVSFYVLIGVFVYIMLCSVIALIFFIQSLGSIPRLNENMKKNPFYMKTQANISGRDDSGFVSKQIKHSFLQNMILLLLALILLPVMLLLFPYQIYNRARSNPSRFRRFSTGHWIVDFLKTFLLGKNNFNNTIWFCNIAVVFVATIVFMLLAFLSFYSTNMILIVLISFSFYFFCVGLFSLYIVFIKQKHHSAGIPLPEDSLGAKPEKHFQYKHLIWFAFYIIGFFIGLGCMIFLRSVIFIDPSLRISIIVFASLLMGVFLFGGILLYRWYFSDFSNVKNELAANIVAHKNKPFSKGISYIQLFFYSGGVSIALLPLLIMTCFAFICSSFLGLWGFLIGSGLVVLMVVFLAYSIKKSIQIVYQYELIHEQNPLNIVSPNDMLISPSKKEKDLQDKSQTQTQTNLGDLDESILNTRTQKST